MKIIFTLLCVDANQKMYLEASRALVSEILEKTKSDILLSTNSVDLLNIFNNHNRVIVRDNISQTNSILRYGDQNGGEFNYNLKHFAFQDIPETYDAIVYLDCDIKLEQWTEASEDLIRKTITDHEMGATRKNCVLRDEVGYLNNTGSSLFNHKITAYKIRETYAKDEQIYSSKLPSEHFLVLRNDPVKIQSFYKEWSGLNSYLQSINGGGGSWGDGFEIGIAAQKAGITDVVEITHWEWSQVLGLNFNGNKK
jgi:hypothetical protein